MAQTQIIPYIFYRDVPSALEWLAGAFGFKEEMRVGTPSGGMHGEMSLDGQRIMMGQGAKDWKMVSPREATMATMGVSSIWMTSTGITRARNRPAQRSFTRPMTSPMAAPTPHAISTAIRGFSPHSLDDRMGDESIKAYSTRGLPFVSVANSVAMNVIAASRINMSDTPAVPPI